MLAKSFPRPTKELNVKIFRLGTCLKCRGDLVHDEGDWLCLQCGVYYYTDLLDRRENRRNGTLRIARIRPGMLDMGGLTDFGLAS